MLDALSPQEKRSEHERRLAWIEAMQDKPVCCIEATYMQYDKSLLVCSECKSVYQNVSGLIIRIGNVNEVL